MTSPASGSELTQADQTQAEQTQADQTQAEQWDSQYRNSPRWDTGQAQPALVAVAMAGGLVGRLLDVGCGTGTHVLLAAELGLDATGVDIAPTAIRRAVERAATSSFGNAHFIVADVLTASPAELGAPYDTITDCGVFHTFADADRARYVAALRALVDPGARYIMIVFSDEEPPGWGPRRVSQAELRDAMADGWSIDSIEPVSMDLARMESGPTSARCWRTIAIAQ